MCNSYNILAGNIQGLSGLPGAFCTKAIIICVPLHEYVYRGMHKVWYLWQIATVNEIYGVVRGRGLLIPGFVYGACAIAVYLPVFALWRCGVVNGAENFYNDFFV